MDLSAIPVIDTHCHPFPPGQTEITVEQLRTATSVSLRWPAPQANESMLLGRMVVKRLASLFDCPKTWDDVVAARNEAVRADPVAFHRHLFTDANVGMLLIDPGYPLSPTISLEAFAAIMPCPVVEGYRIERFFTGNSFREVGFASLDDFVGAFRAKLAEEAAKPTTRFFKTVIAYNSGLAIGRVSTDEAKSAWKTHQRYFDAAGKILNDYLFWITAMAAKEHGLPFQVHTGHVSQTRPWPEVNPILLTPLLNEPEMAEVRVVLVHGGYPYCTEAGYMTSVYPNVALDLSLMIPWSSIGVAHRIEQTLESAPTDKVMYGSDGIMVPELHWISAINTRRALGRVLARLVTEEVLDEEEAREVAKDILYRNAERIYDASLTPASSASTY